GWIREPADIFRLHEKRDELLTTERYGETSVANLLAGVEQRRDISLDRFIYGLGIRHIGETTSTALARHFETAERFVEVSRAAAAQAAAETPGDAFLEVASVDAVGVVAARMIAAFFGEDHNRALVDNLLAELRVIPAERPKTDTAVAGKTVVFTGSLEKMTRDE